MVFKSQEMMNLIMALFAKFWVTGNPDELLSLLGWNPPWLKPSKILLTVMIVKLQFCPFTIIG
jgi:hypothetical protein